jgi:hypothetical protein
MLRHRPTSNLKYPYSVFCRPVSRLRGCAVDGQMSKQGSEPGFEPLQAIHSHVWPGDARRLAGPGLAVGPRDSGGTAYLPREPGKLATSSTSRLLQLQHGDAAPSAHHRIP